MLKTLFRDRNGVINMAEKSVLRRPQDIDAVINRGGSAATSQEENQEKERVFNLRVPESLVAQVDALRKRRTGKSVRTICISRRGLILPKKNSPPRTAIRLSAENSSGRAGTTSASPRHLTPHAVPTTGSSILRVLRRTGSIYTSLTGGWTIRWRISFPTGRGRSVSVK